MWNKPSLEQLKEIPRIGETEGIPAEDKIVHAHFFIGGCDCYGVEFDGRDLFYGYAILNNDYEMAEWGYFTLAELDTVRVGGIEVDFDLHWKPRRAEEVEKICKGMFWALKDPSHEPRNRESSLEEI